MSPDPVKRTIGKIEVKFSVYLVPSTMREVNNVWRRFSEGIQVVTLRTLNTRMRLGPTVVAGEDWPLTTILLGQLDSKLTASHTLLIPDFLSIPFDIKKN